MGTWTVWTSNEPADKLKKTLPKAGQCALNAVMAASKELFLLIKKHYVLLCSLIYYYAPNS